MCSEPATKKLKLQLTDPDEPLTQRDVIAFQKEALFRCLNQHRLNLGSLKQQYDLSKRQCVDITRKLANLMALIVTLAKFVSKFCENEDERQLCREVSEGDETVIVQLSDPFMRLLTKYSVKNYAAEEPQQRLQDLAAEFKNLQKNRDEIVYENKQLSEEITTLKNFYQDVVREYDRNDSPTVKRVFSKENIDKTNEGLDKSDRKQGFEGSAQESETNGVGGNGNDKNHDQNIDFNSNNTMKRNSVDLKVKEEVSKSGLLEHEIKITDLNSQLEVLKSTVEELEKYKMQNEEELIKLRQQVSAQQSQQVFKIQEPSSLMEKIEHLAKENEKLSQINEDFLSKFQELYREQEIYKGKLTKELQIAMDTLKKHNSTLEKDLVRIRTARDELLGKVAILEAKTTKSAMLDSLRTAIDSLQEQWIKLGDRNKSESQSQDVLMKELQELESAFKELSLITHKKYSDYINQESIMTKLTVEKTKADQKYFAAMRSKDSILVENKNLSKSLSKSNDLVLQLKESDKLLQQKIDNLNEQLQLSQGNERRLIESNKATTLKIMDMNSALSKMKKSLDFSREENHRNIAKATQVEAELQRSETELKSCRIKTAHAEAKCSKLQGSLASEGGDNGPLQEELENFRSLVYCSLCSKNWKNMVIKTCGHVFCEECCKERLASRMRKCPTCNKPFSANDLLMIHL